ncbi:MAG TPA: rhodanese-like domain-containing protein [Aggregatilineaceae bacterium]|nr:rhodanese-like domain-containing protein [Aggregatilineaceae bacterium]
MRKLISFLFVLALIVPLALPFVPVLAQDGTAVVARLEEYNANLPSGYGTVSITDLSAELVDNPGIVLLDVRQPEEYAEGHIAGAFNVPIRDVAKNLNLLPDLNAKIVVVCGSAFRSAIGMTALQILGYTDVRSMSGGMNAWKEEGLATVTDAFTPEAGTAPEVDADVLAAVDAGLSELPEGFGGVKAEDLNAEMADNPPALLIDVRTPDEWAAGYIPGAVHMPLESFMSFAAELPTDKAANLVVYCKGGHRGNMAATMLRTLGYTNVRNLSGGIGGWTTAGLAIEGAAPAEPAAELDLVALLDSYITGLPNTFNAVKASDLAVELAETPDLLLVDVRTVDEYIEGHIEGAINIPITEITAHLDMLPELEQPMVIYCGSGHRSAMAMTVFNLLGYVNARNMLGGVKAWTAAELPLTTDETAYEAGTAPAIDPALLAALDAYVKAIPAGYYAISADDLNVALAETPPALIDVRTDEEVANGIIEGAQHIELRTFVASMSEWPIDKGSPIVIYCGSDHRAVIAMVAMQLMGYQDVRTLGGGLQAWLAKEYPVVQ